MNISIEVSKRLAKSFDYKIKKIKDEDQLALFEEYYEDKKNNVKPENSVARNTLILGNFGLVLRVLKKEFNNKDDAVLTYEDRVQLGNMGLIYAVDNFDSSKNVAFSTFAYTTVYHAIIRGIQHIYGCEYAKYDKYFDFSNMDYMVNNPEIEDDLYNGASRNQIFSENSFIKSIEDKSANIYQTELENNDEIQDLKNFCKKYLYCLTPKEQQIITLYFDLNDTGATPSITDISQLFENSRYVIWKSINESIKTLKFFYNESKKDEYIAERPNNYLKLLHRLGIKNNNATHDFIEENYNKFSRRQQASLRFIFLENDTERNPVKILISGKQNETKPNYNSIVHTLEKLGKMLPSEMKFEESESENFESIESANK